MTRQSKDPLEQAARIEEQPFQSGTVVVGPFLARFRQMWNNVATRWYVLPILHQQNHFNQQIVKRLQEQDLRLVEQDREQVTIIHDLGVVSTQLSQSLRLLSSIEERLARLETKLSDNDA